MSEPPSQSQSAHPFVKQALADKVHGTVVGAALGDAIGLYTEFLNKAMSKDAYPESRFTLTGNLTRFCNDSHRNKFFEGSWTDDTDHALLILLSYLHSDGKELSSLDFARRLRIWIEQGLRCLDRLPLGLGRATGSVVIGNDYLNDPKAAAFRQWANSTFTSAPNGSLMRTYPLGLICLEKSSEETLAIATDFCLVTHADPRCIVSCCIATLIMKSMLLGDISEEVIDQLVDTAADYVDSLPARSVSEAELKNLVMEDKTMEAPRSLDRAELYTHTKATSYLDLELDDLRKQGYVYKCLGSSILCLRLVIQRSSRQQGIDVATLSKHQLFEDLITELVMEGGDADTNATVAGAFLGCYLGFPYLPSHWYQGVRDIKWLIRKADALVQTLGVQKQTQNCYIGADDPDTAPDGGKGLLTRTELEAREKTFMEMYLTKTLQGKNVKPMPSTSGGGGGGADQWLTKKWKNVFG